MTNPTPAAAAYQAKRAAIRARNVSMTYEFETDEGRIEFHIMRAGGRDIATSIARAKAADAKALAR